MKKLIPILALLLGGCAAGGIDAYYDALGSVELGDDYDTMISKMRYRPPEYRCWRSVNMDNRYCAATYSLYGHYTTFYFTNDVITEIGS